MQVTIIDLQYFFIANGSEILEVASIYCKLFQYIASGSYLLEVALNYCKLLSFIGSRSHILEVVPVYWKSFQYIASRSHLLEPPYIASCHILQVVLQTAPILIRLFFQRT